MVVHDEHGTDTPVAHSACGLPDRLVVVHPDGAWRHHVAHLGAHDVLPPGIFVADLCPMIFALPARTGVKPISRAHRRPSRRSSARPTSSAKASSAPLGAETRTGA